MASVKGSKQEQMIVVPARPWHRWQGQLLLLGISLAALFLVWRWGMMHGRNQVLEDDGPLQQSSSTSLGQKITKLVGGQDVELQELREQLVRADQASQVDKLTLQNLRVNIQRLRQQISLLEEDVLFYKNIASSGNEETGLVVSQLDLQAADQANRFRYKLRFEQAGRNSRILEGFANIAVAGVKDDTELTLPLSALTNTMQGESIKLRFRSFQDVEGELNLPSGFEPSRFEVLAVTEVPDSKTLQKNFSWLVESGQLVNDEQ